MIPEDGLDLAGWWPSALRDLSDEALAELQKIVAVFARAEAAPPEEKQRLAASAMAYMRTLDPKTRGELQRVLVALAGKMLAAAQTKRAEVAAAQLPGGRQAS